jgi:predicted nucleic acid-binding protein
MNGSGKVLVDTSAWIEFFRGREPGRAAVEKLMDEERVCCSGLILAELLQGARSEKEMEVLRDFMVVFDFFEDDRDIWAKAGALSFSARKKGKGAPLSDCLLAVLASENGCAILTLDVHFEQIAGEIGFRVIRPD